MISHDDVVLTLLQTSVGLGGLLLVFCGFVFSQAAAFPPETTDDAKIAKYRSAGKFGLWLFLGSLIDALLGICWFLWPDPIVYNLMVAGFAVLLVCTGVYGLAVGWHYL